MFLTPPIRRFLVRTVTAAGLLAWSLGAALQMPVHAASPAEAAYARGMALQQEQRTLQAIAAYREAVSLDPAFGRAYYELGWSYWILGDWAKVIQNWEAALRLKVDEPDLPSYLSQARARAKGDGPPVVHVPIGTKAVEAGLSLELVRRYQHYNPAPESPADRFDPDIYSPKSVMFSPDGAKAYVNSLEGGNTVVYDAHTGKKITTISHRYSAEQERLFDPKETAEVQAVFAAHHAPAAFNRFMGKPVEAVFTHGGRYLWISYYRRDFDSDGVLPSAVGIIDTRSDTIVRVMPTGPIPKYLAASPDGHWLAVMHWGDNTVGLIDIQAPDPAGFRRAAELVVETKLPLDLHQHVDRDRYCGFCLRGAVFTPDSKYLLVGRMGGGGVAVLDIAARKYVGTVFGMPPTPRHLVLSPDGTRLYLSSNVAGKVSLYHPQDLVTAALAGQHELKPLLIGDTGNGTRTIELSADGSLIFAAVNRESRVVVLDAVTLQKRLEIPADSYPVGLGVSPDGSSVWVTSQGVHLQGGNSVEVFRLSRRAPENLTTSANRSQ